MAPFRRVVGEQHVLRRQHAHQRHQCEHRHDEQWQPGEPRHQQQQWDLEEESQHVDGLQGEAIGQEPAGELHHARCRIHDGNEHADAEDVARYQVPVTLLEELRQTGLHAVVDDAGAEHREQQNSQHTHHLLMPRLFAGRVLRVPRGGATTAGGHGKADTGQHTRHTRYPERTAPPQHLNQIARDEPRHGGAQAAENSVDRQYAPARAGRCVADEPGYTDRMVDGGEQPDARQAKQQELRCGRHAGQHRAGAHAHKKKHHQPRRPPPVRQPTRGQRGATDERGAHGPQPDQIGVGEAPVALYSQHDDEIEGREAVDV